MTPLRAKYIRDLVIHGRSEHTQEAYTRYVCDLARYYHRSPELISYEEVTGWLYHLIKERQLSASSVNIAVSAVRFLYAVTLGRETLERSRFATRTHEPLTTGQSNSSWPGLNAPGIRTSKTLNRLRSQDISKRCNARPRRPRSSSTWQPSGCCFPGSPKKACSP